MWLTRQTLIFSSCLLTPGEYLKAKSEETHTLEKELIQLANQGNSFSSQPAAGLRDAGGTANGTYVENSLSWDFEGLNIKNENRPEETGREEFVVRNRHFRFKTSLRPAVNCCL